MKTVLPKSCFVFAFLFLAAASLEAQTRGFNFLRLPAGARASAMGNAYTAMSGDVFSLQANPAAMASIATGQGVFDYFNGVLDIQTGFGGYAHPLSRGVVAFGIQYHDYGSFERVDQFNTESGSFTASSFVLSGAYATRYGDKLKLGGTLKFIHSKIDAFTANAFAADVSVYYDSGLFDNLMIAGGIYNLGQSTTAFIETKEDLPTSVELGISKTLAHLPLQYSIKVQKYFQEDFYLAVGGEFSLSDNLLFRLGYNTVGSDQRVGDENRFAGVATGFGLLLKKYRIDYALTSMGAIGSVNRFSFLITL